MEVCMRRVALLRPLIVPLLVLGFACFVWPTPWAYWKQDRAFGGRYRIGEQPPHMVVLHRRNRFTGEVQVLSGATWEAP